MGRRPHRLSGGRRSNHHAQEPSKRRALSGLGRKDRTARQARQAIRKLEHRQICLPPRRRPALCQCPLLSRASFGFVLRSMGRFYGSVELQLRGVERPILLCAHRKRLDRLLVLPRCLSRRSALQTQPGDGGRRAARALDARLSAVPLFVLPRLRAPDARTSIQRTPHSLRHLVSRHPLHGQLQGL